MVAALMLPPGPWLLCYQRLTHHPTRIGNLSVVVLPDGEVYLRHNRSEPPAGSLWLVDGPGQSCGRYAAAEHRLLAILRERGFFTWTLQISQTDRPGGAGEVLAWGGESPRTVLRDRIEDRDFRTLVDHLLWQLQVMPALLA